MKVVLGTLWLLMASLAIFPSTNAYSETNRRLPWTTSRILGTPDPPPPLTIERVFGDVELTSPVELVKLPSSDRWLICQLSAPVLSFSEGDDRDVREVLNLTELKHKPSRVFGMTFHPEYPFKPWCYLCYATEKQSGNETRVSRFDIVDSSVGTLDPKSELRIISWPGGGHSGGSLQFGRDGYLYISVGDGHAPNPPDPTNTGQDISDLAASILRIDVSQNFDGKPYRIPPDNPFVDRQDARGEVWAFGLRNPWKISFDPTTDTLWAGDVGWEMMEMVYRIVRGGNYGWSLMEGSQSVKEGRPPTGIPITAPMVQHTHLEARSITGGHFYRSSRMPELRDTYLYGDWMTGKIWGLRHDGQAVTWSQELADTTLQIISFGVDEEGEVLVVGYGGGIYRLVPNTEASVNQEFPRRLSQTGLFQSTIDQTPAVGVLPYEINSHHFADNTQSRQWIGVPGDGVLDVIDKSDWMTGRIEGHFEYPENTVLAKTVSYDRDDTNVRLETQVLHRVGDHWNAYNYIWNDEQTDAFLLDNVATDRTIKPRGQTEQVWHHSSRDECLQCHSWNANTIHGFKLNQLDRQDPSGDGDQLSRLIEAGIFAPGALDKPSAKMPSIVSPHDLTVSLEQRARSYLHMNCAHCHRRGGGGTGAFELGHELSLGKMDIVDAVPSQGTFGIDEARIVSPGDPYRSVLLYRLIKSGRGHMPPIGTTMVDDEGLRLIHDWIESMGDQTGSAVSNKRFGDEAALLGRSSALPINDVNAWLTSTTDALRLAVACSQEWVSDDARLAIAEVASTNPSSVVRDLFERYLPPDRRVKRLGTSIDPQALLAADGDAKAGQHLYFDSANDVTCRLCHRIGNQGVAVGPDLSSIGMQRSPAEILDSILHPSAKIDEKYQSHLVLTVDGSVVSGVIVDRQPDSITIVDATGKQQTIRDNDIESIKKLNRSVMPDRLLENFTAEQATDLLAFLSEQKDVAPATPPRRRANVWAE